MRRQHRLDFLGLDAVTADLELVVDAAEQLDLAVRPVARAIAAAIKPAAVGRERIVHESLRRRLGQVEVAAGHAGAAYAQFAGDADRQRLHRLVEHVGPDVGDRFTDRNGATDPVEAGERGPDRRLGRAVLVVQRRVRHLCFVPSHDGRAAGLARDDRRPQAIEQPGLAVFQQQPVQRRHGEQVRHPVFRDEFAQIADVLFLAVPRQDEQGARAQSPEQAGDGAVRRE